MISALNTISTLLHLNIYDCFDKSDITAIAFQKNVDAELKKIQES